MADTDSAAGSTPRAMSQLGAPMDDDRKDGKGKKRSLFGLGKKKSEATTKGPSIVTNTPALSKESSKLSSAGSPTRSPRNDFQTLASSPPRALSNSPRVASPAGSQIFERDVQDSSSLKPSSPAIPTHIQTENYIPSVLDDASEAITNEKLDPDTVEIVTHSSHQPAAVTVTGVGSTPYDQAASEWAEELASFADRTGISGDNASNYGSLDSADVRRLSFISFADVVQSEHPGHAGNAGSRENMYMTGLTSLPPAALNRSPSPIRSPVSSQGGPGTSPPTSNPGSMKGLEMSPPRKIMGSPGSGSHNLAAPSDLNIETMSQALRRTGSSDLSNVRSIPNSPIDGPGSR